MIKWWIPSIDFEIRTKLIHSTILLGESEMSLIQSIMINWHKDPDKETKSVFQVCMTQGYFKSLTTQNLHLFINKLTKHLHWNDHKLLLHMLERAKLMIEWRSLSQLIIILLTKKQTLQSQDLMKTLSQLFQNLLENLMGQREETWSLQKIKVINSSLKWLQESMDQRS